MAEIEKKFFSRKEAAHHAGVTIQTIGNWLRGGKIPGAFKTLGGRDWRIPVDFAKPAIESGRGKPQPADHPWNTRAKLGKASRPSNAGKDKRK